MKIETAKRLYEYRRTSGLSQEQVAAKIGVSRQAVSKWECAESSPDTDNLIALAMLYGVTVDELLFANPEMTTALTPEREASAGASEETAESAETVEEASEKPGEAEGQSTWHRPENPEQDYVNISFSKGIHVHDPKKGEEVHVDWDGIHVDNDKEHVHLDFGGLAKMIREFRKDQEWPGAGPTNGGLISAQVSASDPGHYPHESTRLFTRKNAIIRTIATAATVMATLPIATTST